MVTAKKIYIKEGMKNIVRNIAFFFLSYPLLLHLYVLNYVCRLISEREREYIFCPCNINVVIKK